MKFIRNIRKIPAQTPNGRVIIYMHGYGGRLWQARRHLSYLSKQGYDIVAMDFTDVLRNKDPQDLIDLMDEAQTVVESHKLINLRTIIVGVSLGGLVGFNLVKRFPELNKLLIITGGDVTHIPRKATLKNKWRLSRSQLSRKWQNVNIYTPVGGINDKHIVMLLPKRDKMIDPAEVSKEIDRHKHLNDIVLVNTKGGHFRTIIKETVISPGNSMKLIEYLEKF